MSLIGIRSSGFLSRVVAVGAVSLFLASCVSEEGGEQSMSGGSGAEDSGMESSMMMEETGAISQSDVPGLVTVQSDAPFEETVSNVEADIEARGLTLLATVDHSANAASVGQDLLPTTLFVFGNPEAGTPLMQSSQSAGIDLPQKMLVWEDESGTVNVSYNDPQYVAERHGLTGVDEQLEMISGALQSIAAAGSGTEPTMMEETTS